MCWYFRFIFLLTLLVTGIVPFCSGQAKPTGTMFESSDCFAAYTWEPNNPPTGRNAPYLAFFKEHYALKLNKYMEGYVDLGLGKNECLRLTGPMTLTVVFQLAKQWPMNSALISRWGYMEGQASYELGITPERNIYFRISPDGLYDGNVAEVVTKNKIPYEQPLIVCAVFDPGRKMTVFINGTKEGQLIEGVPKKCFNGHSKVKIGPRFEGIIGGSWFHGMALSDTDVKNWLKTISGALPEGTSYDQWKRMKRTVPRNEPDYLGTTAGMKLVREIDITPFAGSYVCPGDLNNDDKIDFLLYKNAGSYTVPGRLMAIDSEGKLLWEFGDTSLKEHTKSGKADVGKPGTTPALRGIAVVFDIDQDGRSEVLSELWEEGRPKLYLLDGASGKIKVCIESPVNMSIRQPEVKGSRQPSRSHPVVRVAWLHGKDKKPSIILKYGASNDVVCHAFALDASLDLIWHIQGTKHSMGHIPTVSDVDEDGQDEIILGYMLADSDGTVLWDKGREFQWHADTTSARQVLSGPEKEIFISVCGIGPLYCLSLSGDILWSRPREQVEHGQSLWVADFIRDNPGKEVIALVSGHVGSFYTFDAATGKTLASFEHRRLFPSYPDFPKIVNWKCLDEQSLWIPQDRILVDGYGNIVAELGEIDVHVAKRLHCGTSWRPVGAQAFALDICGDEREELILYEPYEGEAIFLFTQPDSPTDLKPYVAQKNAYNIRSYF